MAPGFSDRFIQALRDSGLSQSQLARRCGISPQAVWGYAHGRTADQERVADFARILKVDADWLLNGGGEEPSRVSVLDAARATLDAAAVLVDRILGEAQSAEAELRKLRAQLSAAAAAAASPPTAPTDDERARLSQELEDGVRSSADLLEQVEEMAARRRGQRRTTKSMSPVALSS